MSNNEKEKKEPGCLHTCSVMLGILLIAGIIIGCVLAFALRDNNNHSNPNSPHQDDNPGLLEREANNNDIQVQSDLDLSSLGVKITITPQVNISNLSLEIIFYDENRSPLGSTTKTLGNVKEGLQVSFSISIVDLGWSLAWNTKYVSIGVRGGTVSYFA